MRQRERAEKKAWTDYTLLTSDSIIICAGFEWRKLHKLSRGPLTPSIQQINIFSVLLCKLSEIFPHTVLFFPPSREARIENILIDFFLLCSGLILSSLRLSLVSFWFHLIFRSNCGPRISHVERDFHLMIDKKSQWNRFFPGKSSKLWLCGNFFTTKISKMPFYVLSPWTQK